jgi:hypothetical protein
MIGAGKHRGQRAFDAGWRGKGTDIGPYGQKCLGLRKALPFADLCQSDEIAAFNVREHASSPVTAPGDKSVDKLVNIMQPQRLFFAAAAQQRPAYLGLAVQTLGWR